MAAIFILFLSSLTTLCLASSPQVYNANYSLPEGIDIYLEADVQHYPTDHRLCSFDYDLNRFTLSFDDSNGEYHSCDKISELPTGYAIGIAEYLETSPETFELIQFQPFIENETLTLETINNALQLTIESFTDVFHEDWASVSNVLITKYPWLAPFATFKNLNYYHCQACIKFNDCYIIFPNIIELSPLAPSTNIEAYPNSISLYTENYLSEDPAITRIVMIDADGNRTETSSTELFPYFHYTHQATPLEMYVEACGKEYPVDIYMKDLITHTMQSGVFIPGVEPPSTRSQPLNVKVYWPSAYSHNGLDEKYGHMEYEEACMTLPDGRVIRPYLTGEREFTFRDVPPETDYEVTFAPYYVRYADGSRTRIDDGTQPVLKRKTEAVKWNTPAHSAMSKSRARIFCSTNLGNTVDTYVEWREEDDSDESGIRKTHCPVVGGSLWGILDGLDPEVRYLYRPVFEYDGKKIVGDWGQVFTGNASGWHTPTLMLQPTWFEEDGTVTLCGAVVSGSGDVSEQGFEIWGADTAFSAPGGNRAGATHRFVPCDGISISANLSDLTPGETYSYRVYAIVDGETITGTTANFTLPGGVSKIDETMTTIDEEAARVVGYFNLQGVRSERPFPRLNIVVYSDGKTEKRVFKE